MRPFQISRQLDTADPDGYAQSQTPGGAGNLTLNGVLVVGGVGVADVQRKVLITAAANEAARTFTVTGTDESGNTISETIAGPNATTASSVLDYATVTSVAIDGAATGAITVGTSGVGASVPYFLDRNADPFSLGLQVGIGAGTVDVTVQFTLTPNLNQDTDGSLMLAATWLNHADLTNVTGDDSGTIVAPVQAIRLVTNSGTDPAVLDGIQAAA